MGLQDSIVQLMLGRGNVLAEQARERVAQQELERQNKHRILNGTLRILGTVAPLFLPGAPLAGLFGNQWANLGGYAGMGMFGGTRQDPEYLDPSQYPDILRRRG